MRARGEGVFRRCRRPWHCFASMVCRSAFHAATPLRMRALLRLKNTSIGLSTRAHCSPGFFSFMPVGHGSTPDLIPNAAQREHLYNFVREMRQTNPCSRSTSKTTANLWAAALPAGVATCTSMPRAMWSRACSRIIRTRTSMMQACLTRCARPFYGVLLRAALRRQLPAPVPHSGKFGHACRYGRAFWREIDRFAA